ncbi:phosphatase PAP2 family protein [Lignipirellula cremea]|uniref:PAP2 superfamily protein n=1 Tax=Lignipirellula cremea TaxID=2528010 RepID=A0A518E3N0_9BACT|nr:phosphatase PAP2 family protein [Lignipirellula cremea]QDU98694.1 PAP2 superfamily protein [Lignipirellula cremea]
MNFQTACSRACLLVFLPGLLLIGCASPSPTPLQAALEANRVKTTAVDPSERNAERRTSGAAPPPTRDGAHQAKNTLIQRQMRRERDFLLPLRETPAWLQTVSQDTSSASRASNMLWVSDWQDEEAIQRLPAIEGGLSDGLMPLPPIETLSVDPFVHDLTYADLFAIQRAGIADDYRNFYSPRSLIWLAGGFAVGGLMANTGFDEGFVRDVYLENIVLAPSDEVYEKIHEPKFLGDGYYTLPLFAAAALAEPLIDDLPLGSATAEWGQRSLRTILVGGPPMLALQYATGGSRPGESSAGSKWKPLSDNNGVSGHSFMGAIPFLSAAKMTDNLWLKGGLYVASTLPGLSRVNDDDHYFSQVFLGWWMAYLAASAVDQSHRALEERHYQWHVLPTPNGVNLTFEGTW